MKKDFITSLSAAIAMAAIEPFGYNEGTKISDIDFTPAKKVIPKGCRVYTFGNTEIVALNEKSALKKFKKLQNA